MKSAKNLFIITVLFSFSVSIFGSFLVFNYMNGTSNKDTSLFPGTSNQDIKKITSSNPDLKTLQSNVKTIASVVSPSVVNIIISKDVQIYRSDPFGFFQEPSGTVKRNVGGGSGFFITKNGLILTNKHVVSDTNASYTIIEANGDEYEGKVISLDPTNDLAIIKAYKSGKEINDAIPVSFVNETSSIQVGDFIVAIGNALAQFQNTVTFGVISGLGRNIQAGDQIGGSVEQLSGLIQTDAAINPGNSGGPLVNLSGEVVGINTAVAEGANGLGFAIPLSQTEIDYLIQSIKKYNSIKRAYLGIRYFSINKSIQSQLKLKSDFGDYIPKDDSTSIISGGPADKAGLKPGDIITEVDSTPLGNGISIRDIIKNKFPGEKIKLKVIRSDGKSDYIDLKLGQF
ncbi:MAG: trypsin-like peptidase domain-containing protein [Candidatus Gracilibacteria bacterium]|nr:trypsin-like peptidase domain-containing protein [Candidatus Gracilibacteria bacterium]